MSLHNKVYCRDPPDVKYVKMCVGSECTGADPGILENGGGAGSLKRQVRKNFQTD